MNHQQLKVECCSGNGQWVVARAKEEPDVRWIAIEKRADRAAKIWKAIDREGVQNLFLLCGDARDLVRENFLPASVDEFYINFPDPWPKRRHAGNRLMQLSFIKEVATLLKEGGRFIFVSDDLPCIENSLALLLQEPSFKPTFEFPFYKEWDRDAHGGSFFSSLWESKGRVIYSLILEKQHAATAL